jgi:catechol 2,3-dioxygenase
VMNDRDPHRAYGIAPPSFRLPDSTHVGGVRLRVSDLPGSVRFYEQVLGMHVVRTTPDTATLSAQGDLRPFLSLQTRSGVVPGRPGAFGLYHFAILLPDRAALGRFAAHLSALGVRFGMADHLVSEALYLSDPDNLGIEVYADRPRSAWRTQGRELIMTTDPLDIADLIAAGGERPWEGMPAGARIGHVHLHVGGLGEAEAFYHAALGFDKMVWSYPGALFLAAGGYHHHLGTNVWAPGPSATEQEARLVGWDVVVATDDDVAAAGQSLRAAGYLTEDTITGCLTVDPWGTQLRLVDGMLETATDDVSPAR